MKANAIGVQNYTGSHYQVPEIDTEKAREFINALRTVEDEFVHKEPEKKNVPEMILTTAVGLGGMFLIGKKGFNKASKVLGEVVSNQHVKKLASRVSEAASEAVSKLQKSSLGEKIVNAGSTIGEKVSSAGKAINKNFVQKIGKANLAGAATAVAGTAYVSNVDANGDGVADILEKGVNAYKGALSQIGAIDAVVDLIS